MAGKPAFNGKLVLPELIKGYAVTLKQFVTKPSTLKYPEERWQMSERFRGYPKLVQDERGEEKCVACGLCAVVCPPTPSSCSRARPTR